MPQDSPPEQVRGAVTTHQPVCPSAHEPSMILPSNRTREPNFNSTEFLTAHRNGHVLCALVLCGDPAEIGPQPQGGPGLLPLTPVRYLAFRSFARKLRRTSSSFSGPPF